MRSATRICRRTVSPDGEWGHYEARWWGYQLRYLGPCREFHLDEAGPDAYPLNDCVDPDEDIYDDEYQGED
jgi:hypothetical protein